MGSPWRLFAVYGPCSYSTKKAFWELLSLEAERVPRAWLILRDFNGIFNANDRSSNRGVDKGSRIMKETLDKFGMISIPSSGSFYSWSIRRIGRNRVNSRTDRGVANEEWWIRFPNASLHLLPQSTSDHSPQLLSCLGHHEAVKKTFCFEATWVEDYHSHWVVEQAWHSSFHPRHPTRLVNRFSATRYALSRWNRDEFGNIMANIRVVREAFAQSYQSLDFDRDNERVRRLRLQLNHLLKLEEVFWFQKSRLR
ncbi:hypothetical protein UlMin_000118 [Ulmus minor]